MFWQLTIVALIVAGAATYLVRKSWKTWTGSPRGCGSGCGCGKTTTAAEKRPDSVTLIAPEQLQIRTREPGPS